MKIEDANIVITGAGSGFGKAMSLYFSSKGAKVFAVDINKESLDQLTQEDPSILSFQCDITKNQLVEALIDEIFEKNSEANVLINNAGIMKNAPLVNLLKRPDSRHEVELWDQVIQVNLNAVFYMTRSFAAKMIRKRNKGLIVNISSIAAVGNIGQTAYSASKSAVEAMSRVWAKELGGFGIRSVSIAPGFMNTLGTHDALEEKMLANWIEKTPLRRTGEINEVVLAAQFAIENDFFNGETLKVNGGLVL
ncbi:MAG: SDR family NAD(P)-dependent oxidoreductase [Flavobacteriales bacterium]|nr:SDR family NAD(P)-dependent oxidoreductase [Flavobacteriales bacterium]